MSEQDGTGLEQGGSDDASRQSKRAKAGYHRGGALPFVLQNQVRFVRTWSPPIWRHGAIAAYAGKRASSDI